ncbi:helix-turn-helix domain-containing protein [Parapedobacter sp. ISTM3]|uniref:AraC-type DNA-binding protein n=1 Tax=Parapedobacter luteus TaxID=623280 RepID=A0A1T5CCA3_9SPHI|nr:MULTISPECIES: AraC family transcriptional regulator [Parapedobacter]MBK1439071.1 helix-turn-helix domain-containing protein [Parapedobacter sp. ISTM3]SKB57064.1 AraC-type DNA-binding protein [Parapedobacter luteus]
MKPHFHLVPRTTAYPYLSRQHTLPNFGTVWHYHPELELHYIVRGEGVRFVGDNISNFDAGELLLLGENLPHMWRCNKRYFQGNPNITAEAVVVQFLADFMGRDFLRKPEAAAIHALYERARYGLVIHGRTKKQVVTLMRESVQAEGLSRLMLIFNMLHVLADSKEVTQIATGWTTHQANKDETDRINKVYHYILSNYRNEITLDEIATVAHLSVTSFCRYFKMMTKKTFRDFLIEVRISHAKRMLIEDSISTTEAICFECGFNNRSNFFRHFKRITGCTPVEYRHRYLYENVFV